MQAHHVSSPQLQQLHHLGAMSARCAPAALAAAPSACAHLFAASYTPVIAAAAQQRDLAHGNAQRIASIGSRAQHCCVALGTACYAPAAFVAEINLLAQLNLRECHRDSRCQRRNIHRYVRCLPRTCTEMCAACRACRTRSTAYVLSTDLQGA
jgi:hypothetical protein